MNEYVQEKCVVVCYVVGLFGFGDSIFIDIGIIILLFVCELVCQSYLMVIINLLLIVGSVGVFGNCVFMIGGEYCLEFEQNVGVLVIEQIVWFNVEYVVIIVGVLNGDGVMDFFIEEVEIVCVMIVQVC